VSDTRADAYDVALEVAARKAARARRSYFVYYRFNGQRDEYYVSQGYDASWLAVCVPGRAPEERKEASNG
jgi:hypothetical protein